MRIYFLSVLAFLALALFFASAGHTASISGPTLTAEGDTSEAVLLNGKDAASFWIDVAGTITVTLEMCPLGRPRLCNDASFGVVNTFTEDTVTRDFPGPGVYRYRIDAGDAGGGSARVWIYQ
jgi:hypothetical protein